MSNDKIIQKGLLCIAGEFSPRIETDKIDIEFLTSRGYTVLVFESGEYLIFPTHKLPEIKSGEHIEITVRSVRNEK